MVLTRDSTNWLTVRVLIFALAISGIPFGAKLPPALASQLDPLAEPSASNQVEPATGDTPLVGQNLETERRENLLQLQNTISDAEAARKALESLEQDLAGLRQEQSSLTTALQEASLKRAALDSQISEGGERLAALKDRQAAIHTSLTARRSVLSEVLASLQRIGRDPPPALLISPNDALSSVRSAILLGAVVPEIREETEALARDLQELATLSKSIDDERTELSAALLENDKESERLSQLLAEKIELQSESERRLDLERRRAGSLTEKSVELEQAIAALGAEIDRQRNAALAARQAEEERKQRIALQKQRARELALTQLPEKNRIAPAYAFSALKGTLAYPATGELIRYSADADDNNHPFGGDILVTAAGAVVHTPVDGWVVYADDFRSYGQTLIIDTGDNYHLVLAGMDQISVSQGQFVLAGEPVATMGNKRMATAAALTLATDKSTLYIEIRKDGKSVDPRQWWRDATSSGRVRDDT